MTHPGSEIKLILLDFDGTLADTRRANTLAYVATLREAGYTLTEEEYAARYFGMRCDEFLTRIGIADPAERERLRLRKIALYPTFFDTVRLNEPLWTFCRQFRAGGGRVVAVDVHAQPPQVRRRGGRDGVAREHRKVVRKVEPGAVLPHARAVQRFRPRAREFAEHKPFEFVVVEFAKTHHPFSSPISL